MAATFVKWYGQNTDIEDRKRAEHLLTGEKRLLEMVALGDELPNVLHALCAFVKRFPSGANTSPWFCVSTVPSRASSSHPVVSGHPAGERRRFGRTPDQLGLSTATVR
jgi:hypothetical protein